MFSLSDSGPVQLQITRARSRPAQLGGETGLASSSPQSKFASRDVTVSSGKRPADQYAVESQWQSSLMGTLSLSNNGSHPELPYGQMVTLWHL